MPGLLITGVHGFFFQNRERESSLQGRGGDGTQIRDAAKIDAEEGFQARPQEGPDARAEEEWSKGSIV